MAEEADLDLVVISPNQAPPVAKILNFGNTINDKENGVKISLVPLTEVAYIDEKDRG